MNKIPNKKSVSVCFSYIMFSLIDFLTLKDGTDKLSQNAGKELPLYTAYDPRGVQISSTLWQKSDITVKLFFTEKARSKDCITISHVTAQNTFIFEHTLYVQVQCEDFHFLIHGYFPC
jgi:hypothetical protein